MRIFSKLLAMIIAIALIAFPAYASEAIKGSAESPYKWNEIPATWIKRATKDNLITGYVITVADNKTAVFQLSGTTFKEYRIKGSDGKYGEAIQLNNGKLRTIKDVGTIWLILRSPVEKSAQGGQQPQKTPPNGQKEVKAGDLPVGTVITGGVVIQDGFDGGPGAVVNDKGTSGGSKGKNEGKTGDLPTGTTLTGGVTIVDREGAKPK